MVSELGQKYPLVVKLLKFTVSTPVSEAICESVGSAITVMNKRPVAKDGSHDETGSTNMLTYIMIKRSLGIWREQVFKTSSMPKTMYKILQ